jgi:hypothetical protein
MTSNVSLVPGDFRSGGNPFIDRRSVALWKLSPSVGGPSGDGSTVCGTNGPGFEEGH